MLLNNHWNTEEILKYLETNENKSTVIKRLWDGAKAILRVKLIQSYLIKEEKSYLNNLTLHLKRIEKEEQTKPQVSGRKES